MKNKHKILFVLPFLLIGGVVLAHYISEPSEPSFGAEPIHVDLQLKADKEDILHSSTKNGVTKYDWDTKVPVSNEIDQEVLRAAQAGGYNITGEIIERRTSNGKVFSTDKVNEFGKPIFAGSFIPGERQYHKNSNGDWTHLGNNTTTEEVFIAYMKPTLLERFAGLFGQKVTAADFDIDANGVDGTVSRSGVNETFTAIRNGAGNASNDSGVGDFLGGNIASHGSTDPNYQIFDRSIYNVDTSIIGSGQQVDTGSFTTYSRGASINDLGGLGFIALTPGATASTTELVASDYQLNTSITRLATDFDIDSCATVVGNPNVITLNATGLLHIEMEGVTKFAAVVANDASNSNTLPTEITWTGDGNMLCRTYFSEEGGVDKDPKFTLTWSEAASVAGGEVMMMGMTF